jgi:hypothetical protein
MDKYTEIDGINGNRSFGPEVREKYIDCIRRGMRLNGAAEAVGVCRQMVWVYRKEHPEFQALIDQAEVDACEVVEDALMEKVIMDKHFGAMVFWLVNRSGGRWQDIRHKDIEQLDLSKEDSSVLKQILTRMTKKEILNESKEVE